MGQYMLTSAFSFVFTSVAFWTDLICVGFGQILYFVDSRFATAMRNALATLRPIAISVRMRVAAVVVVVAVRVGIRF